MGKKEGKSVAFANVKGGTGKTTTCVNVAGCLAKRGNQVLVVDFDPQGNATSGLGIDGRCLTYSMYDAFLNQCQGYSGVPITKVILETDIENIHIAPSVLNLGVAPMLLQETKDKTGILQRILEPVQRFYDYILIDVPSDAGLFLFNSLRASEQIVVPIDPGIFSWESLEDLNAYCCDLVENKGHRIKDWTIVLNKTVSQTRQSRKSSQLNPSEEIESSLQERSDAVFVVPYSVLVYRSQQEGLPISHYTNKASKIGKAYAAIATHLTRVSHSTEIPDREPSL